MPLGPAADEVRHARDFLRKWSLGRYLAATKPASKLLPSPADNKLATPATAVLVLSARHTVRDALLMLARAGVLSAPVIDEHEATFLGFCSVADVVAAFIRSDSHELMVIRSQIGPEPGAPGDAALRAPTTPSAAGGIAAPPEFAEQKIASFMPGADGHLLFNAADPGYHRLSLLDVVEGSFLHAGATPGWPTCHRIAVCSNVNGVLAVSAIVSQTDLVRFLLEHSTRGAMGPMANRSLEDLGLVLDSSTMEPRGVLCCDDATPALDAFSLMLSGGVSALGVRSSTSGVLVANLSNSDLRTVVLPDRFGTLALPVRAFLELQAAGGFSGARMRGYAAPRLVTVRADATLADAMRAIVDHGLHHVFVVDADGSPLAVVSCTDVLKLLVPTA